MPSTRKDMSLKTTTAEPEARTAFLSPRESFPVLFERVAEAKIFEDPKKWADVVFTETPELIQKAFETENPITVGELKAFTAQYFKTQSAFEADTVQTTPQDKIDIETHIDRLWDILSRKPHVDGAERHSSIVNLPKPYTVPGGRFGEIYYWDSYFAMLAQIDRDPTLIQNMVDNFSSLIHRFGFIPNGNRTYFLTRSQPPFFYCLVGLLDPKNKPAAYARYIDELCIEYDFWMRGNGDERSLKLDKDTHLNRYYDASDQPREECYILDLETAENSKQAAPNLYRNIRAAAESGWDFSARWMADPSDMGTIETTSILPVDLNAILFGLEEAISQGYEVLGAALKSKIYKDLAERRKAAITKYFWNAEIGCFFDYDIKKQTQSSILSSAALFPLFFGCASEEQAAAVVKQTETHLLKPGGLVTTTVNSGQQWDSPNGWAPLQWIAICGLNKYGHTDLASEIAKRWMKTVTNVYDTHGALYEKYDVVDMTIAGGGEYLVQEGFGWTNGVMAALLEKRHMTGLY